MVNFSDPKKIVIIGCNYSGMLTALALAHIGCEVTILEKNNTDHPLFLKDIRTTAFTLASQKFFTNINIWQYLQTIASPIMDVYVVENKSPLMLHFTKPSLPEQSLGYIVENSKFKQILLTQVKQNNRITLIDKVKDYQYTSYSDRLAINLHGNLLEFSLAILCCGRKSELFNNYFTYNINKTYGQHALTFHVSHTKKHEFTAVEHFLPTGPFAILPLQDENKSSVVWTLPMKQANFFEQLAQAKFQHLVQENFGNFLGKVEIISEIVSFPLKACLVNNYYHQRIVAIADTAHVVHPLAGQGLNQGIKDIELLCKIMVTEAISPSALTHYEKTRKLDNQIMYQLTDKINFIFSSDITHLAMLRKCSLGILDKLPLLKTLMTKYAMGQRGYFYKRGI